MLPLLTHMRSPSHHLLQNMRLCLSYSPVSAAARCPLQCSRKDSRHLLPLPWPPSVYSWAQLDAAELCKGCRAMKASIRGLTSSGASSCGCPNDNSRCSSNVAGWMRLLRASLPTSFGTPCDTTPARTGWRKNCSKHLIGTVRHPCQCNRTSDKQDNTHVLTHRHNSVPHWITCPSSHVPASASSSPEGSAPLQAAPQTLPRRPALQTVPAPGPPAPRGPPAPTGC